MYNDIFIGSMHCSHNKSKLKRIGITHILCCAGTLDAEFPKDFKYKILDALDTTE